MSNPDSATAFGGVFRSESRNDHHGPGPARRLFILLFAAGVLLFLLAAVGRTVGTGWLAFGLANGLLVAGGLGWVLDTYRGTLPGIRNHGTFQLGIQRRRWPAWLLGLLLTAFYTFYYWWPQYLDGLTRLADPLSLWLRHAPSDHWFLYGYFYTISVLLMGVRMLLRYRHSRYEMIRTGSLMFFQLMIAFLLPSWLRLLNQPDFYFSYFWPLQPKYLYPAEIRQLLQHPGGLGTFMVVWASTATFVATPILTYYFGKRWYCSWVCGCGGLAETAGDPFRHLSNPGSAAWKFERWSIHTVLVVVTLGTALLWINDATGGGMLGAAASHFKRAYGFLVASVLAGLVGVAAYPIWGSRVWCRFFCPMAAILGIFQRYLSRFRITTNGAQCISCGNCTTYCEMGIDVRAYAQRGANIVRASCVGCGICSAVCPRGVLNLENGSTMTDRFPGAGEPLAELRRSLKS
jgi:Pyruvate/2-oxoacid:ferredoxin oxidoreductase delta subunit